jgi:transketolase
MSMFEINQSNARQWSRIGSRGVFGQAVLAVAEHHPNMMLITADLGNSSGLDRFKKTYPEQFLNIGIAEQNMIGVAAGMAKEGYNVFATSFAPFITMRAAEQVRMNLGYMGMNVKAVAIGSGVSMAFLGNSHYGIEDAAVMRAIPNLTIVCPADCAEIFKVVAAAADFEGPMYIRLTGAVGNPPVYTEDYAFEIGKAVVLRAPASVTLVATGSMVYESLEASKLLEDAGVSTGVINMHTIKPLDIAVLDQAMRVSSLLVTVEEHSIIGGLGSAVAEYKSNKRTAPPQLILGLPDAFDVTGDYRFLLERHGLVATKIAARVQAELSMQDA